MIAPWRWCLVSRYRRCEVCHLLKRLKSRAKYYFAYALVLYIQLWIMLTDVKIAPGLLITWKTLDLFASFFRLFVIDEFDRKWLISRGALVVPIFVSVARRAPVNGFIFMRWWRGESFTTMLVWVFRNQTTTMYVIEQSFLFQPICVFLKNTGPKLDKDCADRVQLLTSFFSTFKGRCIRRKVAHLFTTISCPHHQRTLARSACHCWEFDEKMEIHSAYDNWSLAN